MKIQLMMRSLSIIAGLFLLYVSRAAASSPSKRGLVFVPDPNNPQDNKIWTGKPVLTWYYNYGPQPSFVFQSIPQQTFEFVPMMWGANDDPKDLTFLNNVTELIKNGRNITHVLSFNEPDGPYKWGGSNLEPALAARAWVRNLLPLQKMGVKVSLPSVMGSADPLEWVTPFLANCSEIISRGMNETTNCTYDFLSVHVYGDMVELTSRLTKFNKA
jgi:hypothetical protein